MRKNFGAKPLLYPQPVFIIASYDKNGVADAMNAAWGLSVNDVPDKMAKAGFTTTKSEFVDAPIINELPMAVECKLISYDEETCRMKFYFIV